MGARLIVIKAERQAVDPLKAAFVTLCIGVFFSLIFCFLKDSLIPEPFTPGLENQPLNAYLNLAVWIVATEWRRIRQT